MKDNKVKIFFKNTVMLYILTFSSYFFNFISVPYQTRILGPDYYGRIGFALAFMTYFRLVIDFGFLLSATEDIANNRGDKKELSKIVSSVNIIKLVFTLLSLLIIIILCSSIDRLREDYLLYIITFLSVASGSFLPDYLYRGIEKMQTITIRAVIIRIFFVVMIFIFLKDKNDYLLIPLLNLTGNMIANFITYIHAYKVEGIRFVKVKKEYVYNIFKKSCIFFYSRIASTAYTATNTFLIGLTYPVGSNAVGLYSSIDKLIITAKNGFSPIADSLYPYMIKNRDFKLVKKLLLLMMPLVIIGSIIVGVYADSFVALLLGEEFREAGKILRILMPIVVMTPLIYILGFPVLSPMGLSKHGNLSTIFGSIVHVALLILLFVFRKLNVFTLSYVTVISEFVILCYRIAVIYFNKKQMSK